MNLQIQSDMAYGDEEALGDFLLVHRLVHLACDAVITAATNASMPNSVLDNDRARQQWTELMRFGVDPRGYAEVPSSEALQDWLYWHDNLHKAEYAFLNLGLAPDLTDVRFNDPRQFYDWMFLHSSVHDTLSKATGVS